MNSKKRTAFTLIEVIVAMGLGMILLAAIYFVMDLQLRSVRSAKSVLIESKIVRGVTNRISTDIRECLAMLFTAPNVESINNPDAPAPDPVPGQYNMGVQSSGTDLTLYISRYPKYSLADADAGQSVFSDFRTIQYSLTAEGLTRSESRNVLSGGSDTQSQAMAIEVTDIRFQFFDLATGGWVGSWDGSTQMLPSAIEITMTIQPPSQPGLPDKQAMQHRVVVAIPTAGMQDVPVRPTTTSTTSPTGGS